MLLFQISFFFNFHNSPILQNSERLSKNLRTCSSFTALCVSYQLLPIFLTILTNRSLWSRRRASWLISPCCVDNQDSRNNNNINLWPEMTRQHVSINITTIICVFSLLNSFFAVRNKQSYQVDDFDTLLDWSLSHLLQLIMRWKKCEIQQRCRDAEKPLFCEISFFF